MIRPSERAHDQLREICITRQYTKYAEGSVLIEFGNTRVLCTASVVPGVPKFLKGNHAVQGKNSGSTQGWLTAEYGMLPRSTHERMQRETSRGGPSGRTQEIQRLIGRSLRSAVDLTQLGDYTINIDCDVLQADGGTRTAGITGACVALVDALEHMKKQGILKTNPLKFLIASVSVGIYNQTPIIDLDYAEDSKAETDMNVVMNETDEFIEVQGTAEGKPFHEQEFQAMLALAKRGVQTLIRKQKEALGF